MQTTRTPTGGFSMRILSGLVGEGQPLYIIDDSPVPVEPSRGIDWFQPEDILRIKVLKDPVETAAYGPPGVNGVILITTKQGVRPRKRAMPPL
ncbi:MAG: TonB-dependent receptor plug domain-containing protein [Gemmatimonadaceae bacterium]|nr:TonB-dependent receptor plug domain-containing protein [Gemmatimonadaceae bacterium]